jgi:hypothetical protein
MKNLNLGMLHSSGDGEGEEAGEWLSPRQAGVP